MRILVVWLVFQLFPPSACEMRLAVFWWKLTRFSPNITFLSVIVLMIANYFCLGGSSRCSTLHNFPRNLKVLTRIYNTTFLFPVLGEAGQVPLSIHVRKQGVVVTHDMTGSISITAENNLFHFYLCILK